MDVDENQWICHQHVQAGIKETITIKCAKLDIHKNVTCGCMLIHGTEKKKVFFEKINKFSLLFTLNGMGAIELNGCLINIRWKWRTWMDQKMNFSLPSIFWFTKNLLIKCANKFLWSIILLPHMYIKLLSFWTGNRRERERALWTESQEEF